MIKPYIYVKNIDDKGRGVFTKERIKAKTIIEDSPVIVMTAEDRIQLDKTLLHDYIFEWGNQKQHCCMALGYIPLYNHSYTSNCEYFMDFETQTIQIKSVRTIEAGEELTINYNGDWNERKEVWFEAT
jgi:Proteins containing SET domain